MTLRAAAWRRPRGALVLLAAAAVIGAWQAVSAQESRSVASADSTPLRSRRGDVLGRPISINLLDVTLETALREVAKQCELRFSYSSDIVPVTRRVSVSSSGVPARDVLIELLRGTDVDAVVTPSGYVVLVRNPAYALTSDGASSRPDSLSGITPAVGRPALRAQLMDRVIVMGTPATGAPERGFATAVTVLTANQILAFGAATMEDLLRSGVPGVVAWDLGISGPFAQLGSVRGSSSFTANYLKTYVDGVELASPYLLFAIDPYSIDRIEIIRGPQGSALYGSDAISGVVQVVTRHGSPSSRWHPRADALLSAGRVQSRYIDGTSSSQRHSAMVTAGGGMSSLGIGGTYAALGALAPGGSSGTRGTFGGFRHVTGPLRVEGTMRYADVRFTAPENPLFRGQTLPPSVRPSVDDQHIESETYGVTVDLQPTAAWRQTVVVGVDRNAGAIPQQREPATVADALLGATRERVSKSSLRYSSMLRLFESARGAGGGSGTLTLGAEQANLTRERLGFRSDLAGEGEGLAALYEDDIHNTGYFGQLKVDVARALFLTAGLRAERNNTFGDKYGTAWSPMLGVAYSRDVGFTTAKVRAAYGKGIRPPAPSAKRDISTVSYRQVANPQLKPEAQSGFEGGVEFYVGDRASLALTGYSQHADGLIQEVILNRNNSRAIQYQNVGRIANKGVEVEGTARTGPLRAALSLAVTESRVRGLSLTYSGDLAVGDRVPEVPRSSGLASLSWGFGNGRSQLALGTTYIGSWVGYDWVKFINDELQGSSTEPELRRYRREYPAVVKPYVSVSRAIARELEWFGRVDNLTNLQRNERDNLQITAGRTFTLGMRVGR